jgi:SAM-dependent methyltransferase
MSVPNIPILLRLTGGTALAIVFIQQCRKPTGWPGQLAARLMNSSHLGVTTWGLQQVSIAPDAHILDVGCGGGKTIQRLLELAPEGRVSGVDYAGASVAVATKLNAASIAAGRADVRRASVSSLPFPPDTFDLVTAVETHYYWPNLEADLREVHRVLKPGGRVAIIAESYRGKRFGTADVLAMSLLGARLRSLEEHREVLSAAGFTDVKVLEKRDRGWMCAVGRRAS